MENKKICIVLPTYNAGKTLEKTINNLPKDLKAEIILVDDNSADNTSKIAEDLKITVLKHNKNLGYGANQKTCYREALKRGADIVIMLHPDCQYDPRMIKGLLMPLELAVCDIVLGNRIRTRRETLKSGMAHNNLGLVYLEKEEFNKELEINPYYDNAYANKGLLYYRMGRMDEAVDSWKKTLEVNPGYSQALYNLFVFYYQNQDEENAKYWAEKAQSRGIPLLPEMQKMLNPLDSILLNK